MLRTAREQSIARLHNETHGVYVTTGIGGTVTLFEGSSYAGRTAAYDQIYTLPAGMNITSVSMTGNTLIFSLGLGYPMSGVNESIGLQHVATRVANTITINTWGMITW
jgi:hypothetical protein